MLDKYKKYAKINIISLFFIAFSFMSVTLAWFAYSGLTDVSTEIGVKAWYIKFDKKLDSSNIVISLNDVYPGMETKSERVKISNLGDSDAQISYSILSARLLNENLEQEITDPKELEDKLSHDLPFHINMNLSKDYALSGGDESEFVVSISWPLDSNQDDKDSEWGSESYKYMEEQLKLPVEERESQIKIEISLKAEQYIGDSTSSDSNYNLGNMILYDISTGKKCNVLSTTCIKTYVLDSASKLSNSNVTLLPDLLGSYEKNIFDNYNASLTSITSNALEAGQVLNIPVDPAVTYTVKEGDSLYSIATAHNITVDALKSANNITSNWGVMTRPLVVEDLLKVISTDINDSVLVRENLSDDVIGNLNYEGRIEKEINNAITDTGYYKFLNEKFPFIVSSKCYWINSNYNEEYGFALTKIDDTYSKMYNEDKQTQCEIVPVIIASKATLES